MSESTDNSGGELPVEPMPEPPKPILDDMAEEFGADEFGAIIPPYEETLYGDDDE
jgi:hypothetical protein